VASFKVLSWHLPGGREEKREKPHSIGSMGGM
jgi:hypothetical protein